MAYPMIEHIRYSHSSSRTVKSCWRRFEFKKIIGVEARETGVEAVVGQALHAGFQHWLKTGDREASIHEMALNYPFDLTTNENYDRSVYAAYATLEALIDYPVLQEYEIARIKVKNEKGIEEERAAIEVPFEFTIENFSLSDKSPVTVSYIGKIDAVLYNKLTDEYAVVDIKTHRKNMNDLSPIYAFDEQCIPYSLVIERLLGRELQTITVRYLSCYVDLLDPRVVLYPFTKTKEDIQDWGLSLAIELQQMKTFYTMGWFPRNPNSCVSFNSKCPFFDLCAERDADTIRRIAGNEEPAEKVDHFGKPWVSMPLNLGF